MTIVEAKMQGGLGNQMFILAAAKTLALKINGDLHFDLSVYRADESRKFELDIFDFSYTTISNPLRKTERKLIKIIPSRIKQERSVPVFKEKGFGFDPDFEIINSSVRLDGYFQSWKYFSQTNTDIRSMFQQIGPNDLLNDIRHKVGDEFYAVHVRRGDYLLPIYREYHGIASEGYIQSAISLLRRLKSHKIPLVFFSDSPELLSVNLRNAADLIVVPDANRHPAIDLLAMSHASGFVISNSSFGWWSAFLSNAKDNVVIAPRPWLRNSDLAASDLLPSNWITLGV